MIPIGDSARSRRIPYVNYAFILVNVAVFLYSLSLAQQPSGTRAEQIREFVVQRDTVCYGHPTAPDEIDEFFCRWSFQPREWFDNLQGDARVGPGRDLAVLITIVTSLFLHAGWLHIGGNLLFLWVFGDNVEDRLGHLGYALFFLAGGVAASVTQGLADQGSVVPVVGASGAVAAVLGAYLVWYPKAMVVAIIPPLLFLPLPVPAILMIGVWFLQNLLAGYATLGADAASGSAVAWFAHIGGFLFGFLLVLFVLRGAGRPPRRTPRFSA